MASAVTELLSYIASIIGPAAGDPRTAASVRTPLGQLASRSKWLKELLHDRLIGVEKTIESCTVAAPGVFTSTAHGFAANTAIRFFVGTSGVLPTGILADTIYYVDATTADTFKVSLTSGPGALVTTTGAMTGPIFAAAIPDWVTTLLVANATYGYGKITDLVVFLAGAQAITGTKTFTDAKMTGTAKWGLTSRGVSRVQAGPWTSGATPSEMVMRTDSFQAAVGEVWSKVLTVPNGATLTKCTVTIDPGAHASLPAVKTAVQIIKRVLSTNTPSVIAANLQDTSGSTGAYNPIHGFDSNVIAEVIDNTANEYYVTVTWESGADSVAGDMVGVAWTATVSSQDDAAS